VKKLIVTGALAALTAAGVGLSAMPAEAASAVQIYRVSYNSPGSDTGSNSSLNGEWVQLFNTATTSR
jgi:hypothetical protein